MDQLQSEWQRLYLPALAAVDVSDSEAPSLVDENGSVRALVLELARPADWEVLSRVWTGVQADLGLSAPAIAVSGADGLQLWFSLGEAVAVAQAQAFLELVRARYLPDVAAHRVSLMPALDAVTPGKVHHARLVPALQPKSGYWSAFVSSELAPVFAEAPWMDIPPSRAAQAVVLSRLGSTPQSAFAAALQQLSPAPPLPDLHNPELTSPDADPSAPALDAQAAGMDPKQFLLQVMNDPTAALALRIEAAKALLPYWGC